MIQRMSDKVDLHYSPDDKGWYFQEYNATCDRTSQLFRTEEAAKKAWRENAVKWRKL